MTPAEVCADLDIFDRGAEPPLPDRGTVNSWSLASMEDYLHALARRRAWLLTRRAADITAGREEPATWHSSVHAAVLSALAAAEDAAPLAEKPSCAARLNAYADAYGLKGWYRCVDRSGKSRVQVNRIRTVAEADHGRYFIHHACAWQHRPTDYWVIDRDSGSTAYRTVGRGIAEQWIDTAENRGEADGRHA